MARTFPMQDKVAIIGVGRSPYGRDLVGRTTPSLVAEAARNAITDARIPKEEIDGICGTHAVEFEDLQEHLGIPRITWTSNIMQRYQQSHQIIYAASAVFAGLCRTALVARGSRAYAGSSARTNPFRATADRRGSISRTPVETSLEFEGWWAHVGDAYGAWGARYMHEYKEPREAFGMIAINNRMHASKNPLAQLRTPITMDDYLNARMIREPWSVLDLDFPVDHGDACVVTTVEHARELGVDDRMVVLHAATLGEGKSGTNYYEQTPDIRSLATWMVADSLWEKSEIKRKDVQIFFPYDGFTFIALFWLLATGWCGLGEAHDYLKAQLLPDGATLKLDGRTYLSTNGGSLSEGASQGSNYIYEAVRQLRREVEPERQVEGCSAVLLTIGGIFHNGSGMILRRA